MTLKIVADVVMALVWLWMIISSAIFFFQAFRSKNEIDEFLHTKSKVNYIVFAGAFIGLPVVVAFGFTTVLNFLPYNLSSGLGLFFGLYLFFCFMNLLEKNSKGELMAVSNTHTTSPSDNRPRSLSKEELQTMSLGEIQARQEDLCDEMISDALARRKTNSKNPQKQILPKNHLLSKGEPWPKFVELDGDVYRIDKSFKPASISAFRLDGDSWVKVPGELIATLCFEGLPLSSEEISELKS